MRLFVTLVVLLLTAARAHAGGEIGLVVTGDGSIQPQLTAQIADWLQQHNYQLKPAPLPADAVTALQDCFVLEDKACERDVIDKRSRVRALVFAVVDLAKGGSSRDITLTVYWFERGREPLAERRTCERCTDQTLRGAADALMAQLAGTSLGERARLEVTSTPSGASVAIDSEHVGTTPLEYDVEPGAHVVVMTSGALPPSTKDVTVARGQTAAVDASFVLAGHLAERPSDVKRYAPYALVGAGALSVIAGAIMIAVDEDPGPDKPPTIRNTGPAGFAFLAGGVVVGGVGAYLWYRNAHAKSAPVAAVGSGGAFVGWQGRF